ncbi:MAG TPA: hypothetical protein VIZ28_02305, partial [Chitinophagaceae bacterium]
MNPAVDQLAISIFKKPLNECSADELRQMAHQYPWFAPVQLLYAKKLQAGNPTLYEAQVQKTSLYFQNRLWLHHLLNDNGSTEIVTHTQAPAAEREMKEKVDEIIEAPMPEPMLNEPIVAETEVEPSNEPETIIETVNEDTPVQTETEPSGEIPGFKFVPAKAMHAPLTFEPYHTIDYFASQGIKFKEEEKPKDQFGQQLKSFTEW